MIMEDIRELVAVRTIDNIIPIENADALEAAVVGGWQVVVGKGEFKKGEEAVYAEIDSLLPIENPAFAFLASRGTVKVAGKEYHRLRTIKLRGVYSQGLLVPLNKFQDVPASGDLSSELEVLKYGDVLEAGTIEGKSIPSDCLGVFPDMVKKTDAERIQNLTKIWNVIKEQKVWTPTLKYDGSSTTFIRSEEGLRICSRNYELKVDENMPQYVLAKEAGILDLAVGTVIQAELYGEGIQKNRHHIKGKALAIFNILQPTIESGFTSLDYVPRNLWDQYFDDRLLKNAVAILDLELPDTPEEAIQQVEGMKIPGTSYLAEGVVWSTDRTLRGLKDRNCFKVINNKYLLKD